MVLNIGCSLGGTTSVLLAKLVAVKNVEPSISPTLRCDALSSDFLLSIIIFLVVIYAYFQLITAKYESKESQRKYLATERINNSLD
jgi:hypothetical protein